MAVAEVAAADATPGTGNSFTIGITVSGTDPVLIVEVGLKDATATVSSVSWSLGSGTTSEVKNLRSVNNAFNSIWAIPAPAPGAGTITVNLSASVLFNGTATCFSGSHQIVPSPVADAVTSTSNAAGTTLTPTNLVVGDASSGYGVNVDAGNWTSATPNQRSIDNAGNPGHLGGDATGTTGVTLNNDGTIPAGNIALVAVRIQQAVAGNVGVSLGNYAHPGQSPGDAGIMGSSRFLMNWWPYTVATDVAALLTGVSSSVGVGAVGVTHTNTLTGVVESSSVGTIKANTTKVLSGVQTATGRGTLGVARTTALTGRSSTTGVGSVGSARTVALAGVQTVTSVGSVTVQASGDVTVALAGVQTLGQVGSLTASGADTGTGVVSKTRHIIYVKGKRYKSSHREMDELLDRVFSPDAEPPPAPLVEQVHAIVKPFIYRNELNIGKLYKDMTATRALFAAWEVEVGRLAAEDEDDDESVLLMG